MYYKVWKPLKNAAAENAAREASAQEDDVREITG
jgi:hypothetical protein